MKVWLLRVWRPILVAGCVVLGTSCEDVSVTAVNVASLTLTPGEGAIAQGDTVRIRSTLQDASGNSLSDRPVEWSTDQPDVVGLEADGLVRGLTAGTAIVRASSGAARGEAWITVMEGPVIVLSTTELTLQGRAGGPPTGTRSVEISNGGGGTLTGLRISVVYPGGEPAGWLEAELRETSAPTVLLLRGNPKGLSAGEFQPQVLVSSEQAANSPQVIEISFEVDEEAPAIEVKPQALGFSMSEGEGAPAAQTVTVTNVGAGELTDLEVGISYADGEPTGWLDAGLAGTTAPTALTLQVDPEGLKSPVSLDAVVEITSPSAPGSTGAVSIRFRLGEPFQEIEDSGPCGELDRIRADLRSIEDANPGSDLADGIEDVRQKVEEAYVERCVKSPPDRGAAAGSIEGAVDDMLDVLEDGLIGTSQAEDFLDRLLSVSRTMAIEAIEAAEARGGRWGHIVQAHRAVSEGDRLWNLGSFEEAAASYESAISRAEGA